MPLSAEQWPRVKQLFDAAVELDAGPRQELLDRECGDEPDLRREVESLLASDERADDFIETPAAASEAYGWTSKHELLVGRQLGAYRIIEEIGRGGLGTVYLAARADDQYQKQVAIKLVRRGLDTDDILSRFRAERQILAQLDHPNIARLIDAGSTEDGLPYFVMEHVAGEPISSYCEARKLNTKQRLELFRFVCSAVTYAHQHLVIHRDIKPSNILVTDDGIPKLLDFGIAKVLHTDGAHEAQTLTGIRVMTPEYASPEQVRGGAITTSSDIYSLGVLLYELLTGQKPYRLTTRTPDEISRAVAEQVPERPSAAAAESMVDRRSLRGDLDKIVLMALRKEPERRYASVAQFAGDIERHLQGRPVLAHKDTLSYRATKFIKRNKIAAGAALLVLLTLVAGIIATTRQANYATRQARIAAEERDRARKQATKADRLNAFLQNILGFSDPTWLSANPKRNREATIADALDEAGRRAETELADEPEVLAAVHFTIGWTYKAQAKFAAAEPHLRAALEMRQRFLGNDHPDTAQSLVGLGEFHHYKGQFSEAKASYTEAVEIYRRAQRDAKPVDDMWFAIALNNLGTAELGLGRLKEAEPIFQEGLEVGRYFTGNKRAPVAVMLSNLGLVRREQGDLERAVEFMERGLQEYRSLPGEPRFEMGAAMFNLATTLTWMGEYDRAETLAREAFEVIRNGVGEKHPYTPRPLIALSTIHYQRGEYAKAREEIERALQLQLGGIPEGHLDFATSWIVLGKILTRTGDAATGETHLRAALDLRARTLPDRHHLIADAQGALGECLRAQGRLDEAKPHLVTAHGVLTERFGEGDPRTREVAQELAALREASG